MGKVSLLTKDDPKDYGWQYRELDLSLNWVNELMILGTEWV